MAQTASSHEPKPSLDVQAEAWIDNALSLRDIERQSPLEWIHVRPWSSIGKCESSAGNLFFKTCEPAARHEIGILGLLSDRHADCAPQLLASDQKRGWLLMMDAGLRLREQVTLKNWERHWQQILTRYARLQLDLISSSPKLLELGVPDRRLPLLTDRLEAILEDHSLLLVDLPDGLSQIQLEQLQALLPTIRQRCEQLEQAAIPQSINHGDFHDANIFLRGDQYVFLDWGDASLSHPFFSLRTTYVSLENSLGFEENSPVFTGIRDTYLETWRTYVTKYNLTTTFELAQRLWSLGSLFSWQESLLGWPQEERGEYEHAIPSLLIELLEANTD